MTPKDRITERGFVWLGVAPIKCTYGRLVEVYESSSASGPRVWVSVENPTVVGAKAAAHLNPEQARELRDRLDRWLASVSEEDSDIHDLIERSSLGTPEAKALRDSVSIETAREIVRRSQLPWNDRND